MLKLAAPAVTVALFILAAGMPSQAQVPGAGTPEVAVSMLDAEAQSAGLTAVPLEITVSSNGALLCPQGGEFSVFLSASAHVPNGTQPEPAVSAVLVAEELIFRYPAAAADFRQVQTATLLVEVHPPPELDLVVSGAIQADLAQGTCLAAVGGTDQLAGFTLDYSLPFSAPDQEGAPEQIMPSPVWLAGLALIAAAGWRRASR